MEKRLKKHLKNGEFTNVPSKRSSTMAAIRGKNNKTTDLRLKLAIVRAGINGWRGNFLEIKGKPDIYFPKERIAVFVDGCFWHGCKKCGHFPKTRKSFWKAKILRNIQRDKRVNRFLKKSGIKVCRFWEHELATSDGLKNVISKIQ